MSVFKCTGLKARPRRVQFEFGPQLGLIPPVKSVCDVVVACCFAVLGCVCLSVEARLVRPGGQVREVARAIILTNPHLFCTIRRDSTVSCCVVHLRGTPPDRRGANQEFRREFLPREFPICF